MATYEDVVTKYGDPTEPDPIEGTVVYAQDALDRQASTTFVIEDSIRQVAAGIMESRNSAAIEQSIAPIRASQRLTRLLGELAHSEINPSEAVELSRTPGLGQARRLFVARNMYAIITGVQPETPVSLFDALPTEVGLNQQSRTLERASMALEMQPASFRIEQAIQLVARAGYMEEAVARIALSELDPGWLFTRFSRQNAKREGLKNAAKALLSTRNIARKMQRLTHN